MRRSDPARKRRTQRRHEPTSSCLSCLPNMKPRLETQPPLLHPRIPISLALSLLHLFVHVSIRRIIAGTPSFRSIFLFHHHHHHHNVLVSLITTTPTIPRPLTSSSRIPTLPRCISSQHTAPDQRPSLKPGSNSSPSPKGTSSKHPPRFTVTAITGASMPRPRARRAAFATYATGSRCGS